MEAELDEILTAGIEKGAAPGVVAVVVDRDGVRYEGAFGERQKGSGVPMTTDTVGAIFSMTKAVTGAAAMQLVEQGRIDLDGPAGEVCPFLGEVTVLDGFDGDGRPVTRPPASPVTLRQLLTHTSGFVYDIWHPDLVRWHEVTGVPTILSLEKASLRTPLAFDPGTRWEYGIGLDWVGQIVEAVSGQTLGSYFAEHVTGPLGMDDTAFAHTPSMLERAAAVHARLPDGELQPIELSPPAIPEFEMGGGGLHSTMGDYGRFMRMILRDGELDGRRVLESATVEQMATNQIGDIRVGPLTTAIPQLSNDVELFPGQPKSWGLTFQINETPCESTGRPAGTLMWAGLANSYYWIDRHNGIGGAYLSQILPFGDAATLDLFYDFERAVYASL
ncbi:MAG TPA: serine hydrolase domain-containing protein [Acidimicrobiia bacterium]|nr:serine hydrolase domain-containing protein [Acidimicrobiia bacterium]